MLCHHPLTDIPDGHVADAWYWRGMCSAWGHVPYYAGARREGRSEDLQTHRRNPNTIRSFHRTPPALNFPRVLHYYHFLLDLCCYFPKQNYTLSRKVGLFMIMAPKEVKYNNSHENGFLSVPFPNNLLSKLGVCCLGRLYNYNTSRTWNLHHSRQKERLKCVQHPNNEHRKRRGKTSHIPFFHRFSLHITLYA